VEQLRDAGFEALWAGGCVRDMLMDREPKDYDVATNARPDQIRDVFGHRRTLAIGASFGVIALLGPSGAGQIDVATFRQDAEYSDGRHPDSVSFCNAEEDAQRRDFTINGLFYDPLEKRVIDYVGGQADLKEQVIRAIGDPTARFREDKLRVLRAVRFAATLGFKLDSGTSAAIREFSSQIRAVSAERITEEMKRILVSPRRRLGLELLSSNQLLPEILPEADGILVKPDGQGVDVPWDRTLQIMEALRTASFTAAMAVLLRELYLARSDGRLIPEMIARAWRLSKDELEGIRFCLDEERLLRSAPQAPWPQLQRTLIDPRIDVALAYAEAVSHVLDGATLAVEFCRERLAWPREMLNPVPLIGGHDLFDEAIPRGRVYKQLLDGVREAQLLGQLKTKEEALAWVRTQWAARNES
jgi:hypothetical protein